MTPPCPVCTPIGDARCPRCGSDGGLKVVLTAVGIAFVLGLLAGALAAWGLLT